MVQVINLCCVKLLSGLVINLRSVLKTSDPLKVHDNQKLQTIFDSALPIDLDSYTHFHYLSLDIGRSCAFAKTHDPQEECMLLCTRDREFIYLKSHSKS